MKYICNLTDEFNEQEYEIAKYFDLDKNLVHLLYSRGIDNKEKMNKFLYPNLSNLYDPFLFENMSAVVEKIQSHLEKKSKILIYGDYDVDGITASAILIKYFNSIGANVTNFMPNRYEDGYGITIDAINKLISPTIIKPTFVTNVFVNVSL